MISPDDVPDASTDSPPLLQAKGLLDVLDNPHICGWALGYPTGYNCTAPSVDEHYCAGHNAAAQKIEARAQLITEKAHRKIDSGSSSLSALKNLANAEALAEKWWLKAGIRAMSAELYEDALCSGPCAYCGFTSPSVVDHIVPVAQGGLSMRDNLAPACRLCNSEKGNQTPEQWQAWRAERGLCWPPQQITAILEAAVDQIIASGKIPSYLDDLLGKTAPKPSERRTADYEDDPRWQAASDALGRRRFDLQGSMRAIRQHAAIRVMYVVELEYENANCQACKDSGRAVLDGVDRHCDCQIGRALRAEWRQGQLFGELV